MKKASPAGRHQLGVEIWIQNPCFQKENKDHPNTRELTTDDVFYSLKRMANRTLRPQGWWVFNGRIKGFDAFKEAQNANTDGFNYAAKVPGFEKISKYQFRIHLTKPYPQFLFVLAMNYTSVVAKEAVEYYGDQFPKHPIGTGPFTLKTWKRGSKLEFVRNPDYRQEFFPKKSLITENDQHLKLSEYADKQIPFLDGIIMEVYEQVQPAWLKWRVQDLDFVRVPAEFHDAIFNKSNRLRQKFKSEGVEQFNLPLLDFIYRGFNMKHPITGGEQGKKIRQAISLAMDTEEFNDRFYNNTCILYDGPIPPGLDGFEPGVISPYRGPNLSKARELLKQAGYEHGQKGGKPLEVFFETTIGGQNQMQAEVFTRQLKRIGIDLKPNFNSFPELLDKLHKNKAQMFGLAWGSDYPDAENNLALFYGPNAAGGMNHFNYSNPEYDQLYERISTMQPSPARTVLYKQMRDLIIEQRPAIASMARTRFYVWNGNLKAFKPSETWYTWIKFLDVDRLKP